MAQSSAYIPCRPTRHRSRRCGVPPHNHAYRPAAQSHISSRRTAMHGGTLQVHARRDAVPPTAAKIVERNDQMECKQLPPAKPRRGGLSLTPGKRSAARGVAPTADGTQRLEDARSTQCAKTSADNLHPTTASLRQVVESTIAQRPNIPLEPARGTAPAADARYGYTADACRRIHFSDNPYSLRG